MSATRYPSESLPGAPQGQTNPPVIQASDSPARVHVTPDGRHPDEWADRIAAAPSLRLPDLLEGFGCPVGRTRLVVVSAHPDDETIGAGRLLSHWVRGMGTVTAVLATAGEACLDHVAQRPDDLAERRLAEWHAALDRLGVNQRVCLGLRDGGLAAQGHRLRTAIVEMATGQQCAGEAVVIAAPFAGDPHPDHAAVGRAAQHAAQTVGATFIGFPVWLTYWTDPDTVLSERLVRLLTNEDDDLARDDALRHFRTQLEPLAPGLEPVVPTAMLAHHANQLILLKEQGT